MYVVVYKNKVVLGIIPWNNEYIMTVMKSRYRVNIEIPKKEPVISLFPYHVNEDVIIYPAEENRPNSINPMIEYYYGPNWEFKSDKVIANYEIKPLSLENAKSNYREKASLKRYEKEVAGTTVVINENEHEIETDRNSRSKYVEKLSSSNTNSIKWKFKDSWEIITKENLQYIIDTIDNHVQLAFDEEYDLFLLIDQAQTIDDLLEITELNEKKENVF